MNDVKSFLESKTIWAAIVTLGAAALAFFGYSVTPEDQAAVPELVAGIGGTVGALGAIYGRIKASKKIG